MIAGAAQIQGGQHMEHRWWSGGISNPLSVIEQLTYLLFIKRLDELHTLKERKAARTSWQAYRGSDLHRQAGQAPLVALQGGRAGADVLRRSATECSPLSRRSGRRGRRTARGARRTATIWRMPSS